MSSFFLHLTSLFHIFLIPETLPAQLLIRMSWQPYIDNLKAPDESGNAPVEEAAICGLSSGAESVWCSTPALANITVDEIKKLANDRKLFPERGAFIAGKKCMMLRDNLDTEGVYTLDMKSAKDADGNAYGLCVGKSSTALIIAQGKKDATGGQLATRVYKMVEYLRKSNM
ncbi:profilin-1 [Enoplosus armatus]|uniref:profilin-1 n=1 Tax=Enoplosus armatus TaxID=215367 RepID=UPI0039956B5E